MKRALLTVGLTAVALCTNGCATHSLLHAVGLRQEVPANITQSWVKQETLVIGYTSIVTDGERNHLRGAEPVQRQAVFSLSEQVKQGQWTMGQVESDADTPAFASSGCSTVPRTTEGGEPEALLGTNAVVIQGSQAESFKVIRRRGIQATTVEETYCRVQARRWAKWWRRPVQVVGFPFACLIDAVALPFHAAVWGCFLLHEKSREHNRKEHGTEGE